MNRKQFTVALVCLIAAGIVGGALSTRATGRQAWAQGEVQELVRAQAFHLVDEAGNGRAILTTGDDGHPRLVFTDPEAGRQLAVGVDDEGEPTLTMFDREGASRLQLGVDEDGDPLILLSDAEGDDQVQISSGAAGAGVLISDPDGRTRAEVAVFADSDAGLKLMDADGNTTWQAE